MKYFKRRFDIDILFWSFYFYLGNPRKQQINDINKLDKT